MKPKFGVFLDPIYLPSTYSSFREEVLEAERLGYEAVWVSDHLASGSRPVLECFTMLSALASLTHRIRLGSLVACSSYRLPSILAKMASTLDVISDGRLEFGIGAGWNEEEYRAYGIPFPKPKVRIAQLEESVKIAKKMWTEETATFKGEYFSIEGAYCEPKPVQKPHPPITIGGSGEKLTLKVVAKYADRSNWGSSPAEFARKMKVLETHCSKVRRDFAEIEKSWFGRVMISEDPRKLRDDLKKLYMSGRVYLRSPLPFDAWYKNLKAESLVGTLTECMEKVKSYMDLGVTYFTVTFLDSPSTDNMRTFAGEIKKRL